jgi:hypothetical protein
MSATTGVKIGHGTTVRIGRGGTPTYTALVGFDTVAFPAQPRADVDTTHSGSPNETEESIPGLRAGADWTLSLHYVQGNAADVLLRQCSAARLAHIAKQPKNCKPITKTARGDAFAKGWVWGVSAKVEAFAQPTRNKALLLTYMERNHGEMKSTKVLDKSKLRKLDDGHLNAGWHAGRKAELNRGVGGTEERRLIA